MQITRLPHGNMSEIIQIRNISALKDLDHQVRIGDLSDVWNLVSTLIYLSHNGWKRTRFGIIVVLLRAVGNSLPHECRLHHLLECHMFSIILTAMNSGSGWHGQFFCSAPRTGASGENVPLPTTGLQKGQWWSGISVGNIILFSFFSERANFRYSKAYLYFFHANIRRSDCVGPILRHIWRLKLIPYWN